MNLFFGRNLSESNLADLVEIVKQGKFPNGVNLIVEKLDRLYRDKPRRALEHFTSLLNNGVTIHTPLDKRVYSPDGEDMDLMVAIMQVFTLAGNSSDTFENLQADSLSSMLKISVTNY